MKVFVVTFSTILENNQRIGSTHVVTVADWEAADSVGHALCKHYGGVRGDEVDVTELCPAEGEPV
jgi:hypothetical protein